MRLLALDTTGRAGSVALASNGAVVEARAGDPARTHGERLPGDVLALLRDHGASPADVDIYAVAAGPGSFTGLRVGIACIQGLALANARRVVAVSAFDALAHVVRRSAAGDPIATWIDAQRGEVFASLYAQDAVLGAPSVATPIGTIRAWKERLAGRRLVAVGDGAARYAGVLREAFGDRVQLADPIAPMLAPAVAELALAEAAAGRAVAPHAIVPIYVRRPDAELARDAHR
jgi:tRNA threonylcarbamoyladenosine biosynthesis protein TsaB